MSATLLIVAGPPCSGKSTLCGLLLPKFGFRYLQADRILSNLIPDSDRRKSHRDIAYRAMHAMAAELLACGRSVVLDATYTSREHRGEAEVLARDSQSGLKLIECRVRRESAISRFNNRRGHPATDLNEARVGSLANEYSYSGLGLSIADNIESAEALLLIEDYLRSGQLLPDDGRWSSSAEGY